MSTVVIDAATRDKILAAGGVVEFRDEAGNLIGRFARTDGPPIPPAGYEIVGDWPSDEEIDRRERESKMYTAAEVEERLRQLRKGQG
jgi:hypothetical protein